MLLRRITQHVKDQNWFAVGVDFCIVVIGVFIGIQVANWNDALSERQLEAEYISLLARDLTAIEKTLTEQLAHEIEMTAGAAEAFNKINRFESEQDPLKLGQSLMKIWGRRTLTLDSPTFSELKSAGRLSLISDVALRNRVMTYFDGLSRTERITDKNNDFFVEPFSAFVRDSGIGYVPASDGECHPNDNSDHCTLSARLHTATNGALTHSADLVLALPPDDPFWAVLRSHMSFRTAAALSNQETVKLALAETRELSAHLERAR